MKKYKCFLFLTISFLLFSLGNISLSAQCNGSYDCLGIMDTGFNCPENSRYLVDYTFRSPYKILNVDIPFMHEVRITNDKDLNIKLLKSKPLWVDLNSFCENLQKPTPLVVEVEVDKDAPFGGKMRYYINIHWSCADSFVTTGK